MAVNQVSLNGPLSSALGSEASAASAAGTPRISVMIIDGQTLFRTGLARLLNDDDRLLVVACSDGRAAMSALGGAMAVDVMVTDLPLPGIDGIELIRRVAAVSPSTRVLILASTVDWRVIPAMAAGAAGFLLKDTEPEAITSAVISVHLGEKVLCREAAQWLIEDAPARRLTRRERQVLGMVAEGATNNEIATSLSIGDKTVRNYVSRLYQKLAFQSRSQIAAYGLDAGVPGWRRQMQTTGSTLKDMTND